MRATPAICYSLLCLRASHARAAFALQTAPIAAPRGRTGASRIFAASPQPVPRVCPRFFLHRAHARIWQALAFSLSASAMVARVVALLALALLAVTDAVPRRVKQVRHGKLQPSRLLTYLLTYLLTSRTKTMPHALCVV